MRKSILNIRQFRLLAIVFGLICSTAVSALAQLTINNFSPNSGPVGRDVTINGSVGANFNNVTSVRFNGVPAASFIINSATRITAKVAPGTTSGRITISDGTSTGTSSSDFSVYVTWVGGYNGNSWDFGQNWSNGQVPDETTNVMIEAGGSPVVNDAAECRNLQIVNAYLTLNNVASNLMVYGDFLNAGGTYTHTAGTITFAGGTQQVPALDYHNVVIAGNGTKELQGSASVNNLAFSGGSNLVAKTPEITTLALNGMLTGETATSSYIGRLEKARLVDAATSSDIFGNIGIHFNNAGGGNWGNVVVTRVTGASVSNPANGAYNSINRYWDITPQFPNTNTLVSLTFTWLSSELNGLTFPNNKAQAWRSEDNGGSWVPVDGPQTISSPVSDQRTITVQTNTFSKWGISDQNNPLPVSWLYFKGKTTANGNQLIWATASEQNSANFVVERSLNGKSFEAIGTVKAAGNSNQVMNYSFTDAMAAAEKTYYRLKQTDRDGVFAYSAVIVVTRASKAGSSDATVYPNPFAETLNLKLDVAAGVKEIRMLTLDGKEVYRKANIAGSEVTLNGLPTLKPGMYLLQMHGANGITTLKVARQ